MLVTQQVLAGHTKNSSHHNVHHQTRKHITGGLDILSLNCCNTPPVKTTQTYRGHTKTLLFGCANIVAIIYHENLLMFIAIHMYVCMYVRALYRLTKTPYLFCSLFVAFSCRRDESLSKVHTLVHPCRNPSPNHLDQFKYSFCLPG